MIKKADIVVVGAGIAGVSAAAELAADATVILLEMESQPGYHATGRSAAYFAPAYGNEVVRAITAASETFFRAPPTGFTEVEIIRPRDALFIGREDQRDQLKALEQSQDILQPLDAQATRERFPILTPEYAVGSLCDPTGGDLDVDAVMQGYLRLFRQRGGELASQQEVLSLEYNQGNWTIHCGQQQFSAPVVVNAAGAWVDPIAQLAGVGTLGITPMRRTAILIDAPEGYDIAAWPLVVDVAEEFYFKPDAGLLLISPANEDPSPPCDAQPEELDIAIAVDRFTTATGIEVRRVSHSWAGLRSFAPDRTFVAGFDPRHQGFFWLAGQGGYGVQSAPGLAQLAAHQINSMTLSGAFKGVSAFTDVVSPQRLVNA